MLALLPLLATLVVAAPVPDDRLTWLDCSQHIPKSLATAINASTPLPASLACGQLRVPLSYDDKSCDKFLQVGFTLNRASDPAAGLLAYNPGGPGVEVASSGFTAALGLKPPYLPDLSVFKQFNILTMDFRGMYSSTNVNCSTEGFLSLDATLPLSTPEYAAAKARSRAFADTCTAGSVYGDELLDNLGADTVAKDLDSLRQALGFKTMHYLGSSYGTFLGQQLFKQFPDTLDRVVLDSVYPNGMTPEMTHQTAMKARTLAIDSIDALCLKDPTCPFAKAGKGGVQAGLASILKAARAGAFTAQGVTESTVSILLAFATSNAPRYQLDKVLALATTGNVSALAVGNPIALGAIPATIPVVCHDIVPENVDLGLFQRINDAAKDSDPYGLKESLSSIYYTTCAGSEEKRGDQNAIKVDKPYMLVTSDFDANTPTEWTTFAWKNSPNAVLVARKGDGHPVFTRAEVPYNPARDMIIEYLNKGIVPNATDEAYVRVYPASADRASRTLSDPYVVFAGQMAPAK